MSPSVITSSSRSPASLSRSHWSRSPLVPGRAYSYRRIGNAFRYLALSYSNVGATSLFTTVEDLALWDANATSAKVGGAAVQAAMRLRGRLNNGREINYASGLFHGRHRGLPTIGHDGVDAGYRAQLLRYPEQQFTVLLLGNAADMNTGDLARRVADIYLEANSLPERPRSFPAEVELDAAALLPYLGDFEMRPGFVLSFTSQGNQLMVQATGQPKFAMFASASDQFFVRAFAAKVKFDPPANDGLAATALWQQGGSDLPLKRVSNESPSAQALQACAGEYYSEELRTLYRLRLLDGKLMLRYPRGELELKPASRDSFSAAAFTQGSIKLRRNAANECNGLAISTARVRSLEFRRVTLVPAP